MNAGTDPGKMPKPMSRKVVQLLPSLESGGVERGVVELSRHLVSLGHKSVVISAGGRLVGTITRDGGRHVTLPVGRKRLSGIPLIWKLRAWFRKEKPDIIHVRSRLPAWFAYLAWKGLPKKDRPAFVSTFHGYYSPGGYSGIMTRGERVIAVSASVGDYLLKTWPKTDPKILRVIPRGVDPAECPRGFQPADAWRQRWLREFQGRDGPGSFLLCLPGRITRLKGHDDFFRIVARLRAAGVPARGLVAGDTQAGKESYGNELKTLAKTLGVEDHISFLGHRSDVREVMAVSHAVLSLTTQPESFGRAVLEALTLGTPVVAYDQGGVAEQLAELLPEGAVKPGDWQAAADRLLLWHTQGRPEPKPNHRFLLSRMLSQTLDVYRELREGF